MLSLKYHILNILKYIIPIKKIRKKIKQKKREIENALFFYKNFAKKISSCKDVIYVISPGK